VSDFDANTITAAVLARLAETPDARLKQVMTSLVRHLHDFTRDVAPTFEEWRAAIDFLTRTGQMCSDTRQEFILLSDTLGVSMLVDAINHPAAAGATETTVLGPFHVADAPEMPLGADISPGMPGEKLFVEGTVKSAGGGPIAGALVDAWHSDDDGFYDVQRERGTTGRARFRTDAAGRFHFWTIQPAFYPVPDDGPVGQLLGATGRHPFRPAHVHFMIAAEGHETLVTHLFVAGDRYLDSDAVFGVKRSLVTEFRREAAGTAPDGRRMEGPWRRLSYGFGLQRTG
jgi:hydroxyquinol 1,2-dioxygenase